MKHYISSHITVSEIFNDWTFMLTPAIFIKRSDKFCDEAAYYIVLQWLLFQVQIVLINSRQ